MKVDTRESREGLRDLSAGIVQAAALTLRAAMAAAVSSAKSTTLFRDQSTKTRGSIRASSVNGLRGFVEARGAARFLEWGTVAHGPRRAKAMRFTVNGQVLYRRWVKGIAPRPFMREARHQAVLAVEYGAEFYVGYAIRKGR